VGRPGPAVAENDLAARVAMARWCTHGMVTAAAGGAGGAGSPLGEVQLGVRDEHYRGVGPSPSNARERVAHRDDGTT
jgi:hypothetical protein